MGQRELKHDDGTAQYGNHDPVSYGVEQAKPHTAPAIGLHTGDVGDGGDVIVVEPVAETENRRREERKLKAVGRDGHGGWIWMRMGLCVTSSLFQVYIDRKSKRLNSSN